MEKEIFEKLCRLAQEDFAIARDRGEKTPEGISLLTGDGTILTGFGDSLHQENAAIRALTPLKENLSQNVPREDLSKAFEIAAIVIATQPDGNTLQPRDPSKEILDALGDYIGTGDGQQITLISPRDLHRVRTLKL